MELPTCPTVATLGRTCKRRSCPRCGLTWARDVYRSIRHALEQLGGPVVSIAITAPGEDRLPWDTDVCAHRRPHRCSGPRGCRVQRELAWTWADTCRARWKALRDAARLRVERAGLELPPLAARVWEPQKRGVPHLHVVIPYRNARERAAVDAFVVALRELAPEYDFGGGERGVHVGEPSAPAETARYLAQYLTGRNRHKPSVRDNVDDPRMPLRLVWLSPELTRRSTVTMRRLRVLRQLVLALRGRAPLPVVLERGEQRRLFTCYARVRRGGTARARPPAYLRRTWALERQHRLRMQRADLRRRNLRGGVQTFYAQGRAERFALLAA